MPGAAALQPAVRIQAARKLLGSAIDSIGDTETLTPDRTRSALRNVVDAAYEIEHAPTTYGRQPVGFNPPPTLSRHASLLANQALDSTKAGMLMLDLQHSGVELGSSLSSLLGGGSARAGGAEELEPSSRPARKLLVLGASTGDAPRASAEGPARSPDSKDKDGAEADAKAMSLIKILGGGGDLSTLLGEPEKNAVAKQATSMLTRAKQLLGEVLIAESQERGAAARSAARGR